MNNPYVPKFFASTSLGGYLLPPTTVPLITWSQLIATLIIWLCYFSYTKSLLCMNTYIISSHKWSALTGIGTWISESESGDATN